MAFLLAEDDEAPKTMGRLTNSVNRRRRRNRLIARDGEECWYCGEFFDRLTIEEVLPRSAGGPANLANQVLACHACNAEAGTLSVAEKVRLREAKRGLVPLGGQS